MILEALRKKYEADIAVAAANIQVYIDNPAGIGEHPDLVSAVDQQIQLMSEAQEKLVLVNTYFTHTSDLT